MNESQRRYAMTVAFAISREYSAPWPYSRKDLAQAALLDIVRTLDNRDDFDTNGWMVKRCHWSIRSEIKRLKQFGRTGGRGKVKFTPEVVHVGSDDTWLEAHATHDSHDLFETKDFIARFTPQQQRVAFMLSLGYKRAEIARELGVCRSAVTHCVDRMAQTLEKEIH